MIRTLVSKARSFFRGEKIDHELQEEIETHIALLIEENLRRGMPAAAARTAALREFGGVTQAREKVRMQRGFPFLESLVQDSGFALRQLRKSPGFTITSVLTLALGIGANLAIFGLLYALLLRSLPVPHPEQLVKIIMTWHDPNLEEPGAALSLTMAEALRQHQHSIAGFSVWRENYVEMRDEKGNPETAQVEFVSGDGFHTLGVKPFLGRLFTSSDDTLAGPAEGWPVVLSYHIWKEEFHANSNIVGTHLTISSTPVTVIGVLPGNFHGVNAGVDPNLYLPMQFLQVAFAHTDVKWQTNWNYFVLGRLNPGVSLRQANAEIESLRNVAFDAGIAPEFRHLPVVERARLQVFPGRSGFSSVPTMAVHALLLLEHLVIVVLLLCCVNIGGLIIARNHGRRHEFAVRAALGAGQIRLIQQCLIEGLILATTGSLLGLIFAWTITSVLTHFLSQDYLVVHHDISMVVFAGIAALATTLLFGTLPALFVSRTSPAGTLTVHSNTGSRRQIFARGFVPLQIGLSLILILVAGLFAHSLLRILREPRGFNARHVMMLWATFQKLPREEILDRFQHMAERLDQMPGVSSTALMFATPLWQNEEFTAHIAAVTATNPPDDPSMAFNDVSPDYFKTLQIPMIAGREFSWSERDRSVCILNRSAAAFLFPRQNALGQYVRSLKDESRLVEPATCQIVGIVEDAKYASLKQPAPRTIYFPISLATLKNDANGLEFMMRSSNDALAAEAYRKVWNEFASDSAPTTPSTLQAQLEGSIGTDRLMSALSICFAGLALLLSAIGLYGLLTTSVVQRSGEIGIRLALGAQRRTVLTMILKDAARIVTIGCALGCIGSFFAVRLIKSYLYNTSPLDPIVLLGSALLLAGIALFAAFLPARRAASIEPMEALRAE